MAAAQSFEPTPRKPLRVWPGVAAVIVQWIGWFVVPVVLPDAGMAGMLAAIAMTLAIIVWWLFFSRAPWAERLGAIVLMVVARRGDVTLRSRVHCERDDGVHAVRLRHPRPVPRARRMGGGRAAALRGAAARVDGRADPARVRRVHPHPDRRHHGDGGSDLHWRWTPTPSSASSRRQHDPATAPGKPAACRRPQQRRRATARDRGCDQPTRRCRRPTPMRSAETRAAPGANTTAAAADSAAVTPTPSGPAFAGRSATASFAACGSRPTGRRSPPVELWRRPIGPGWSSFAVARRSPLHAGAARRRRDRLVPTT